MKRDYTDGVKEDITYFTGVEIEHTKKKLAEYDEA